MNTYEQATQEVRDAFAALCKGRVEAAVLAEREACAQEFDRRAVYSDGTPSSGWYEPDEPARIIRARGETK